MKKNGKIIIIALVLIVLILIVSFFVFVRGNPDAWLCQNGEWIKFGNIAADKPTTLCPNGLKVTDNTSGSPEKIEVGLANPASEYCLSQAGKLEGRINNEGQYNICIFKDDTRCEEWAYQRGECQPGKNIVIFNLRPNQTIPFPFSIIGEARVFENNFNYRLKDEKGNIIASGFSTAQSPDAGQFGSFEIKINSLFKKPLTKNVTLEILDFSAKDGSEIDLVSMPLILEIGETSTINLYYSNSKLDPTVSCNKVFPVKRIIPKTEAMARAAIEQLFLGPNSQEASDDYSTALNYGVKIQNLSINSGTAKIDFDETLQSGVGGSCRVSAVRAQIIETLKQFSTIKNVIISINGRTEDILQP
ncbi:MAG: GerMN domain-containing protein [Candidatus Buchananbacteria bacterium]